MVNRIIKLSEVTRQTALSKSSIYRKAAEGAFPSPVKLGERASGWLQSEISQWVEERIQASRSSGIGGAI